MPYVLENRTAEGGFYTEHPNRKFKTIFSLSLFIEGAKVFKDYEKHEAEKIAKFINMGGWDLVLREVNITLK